MYFSPFPTNQASVTEFSWTRNHKADVCFYHTPALGEGLASSLLLLYESFMIVKLSTAIPWYIVAWFWTPEFYKLRFSPHEHAKETTVICGSHNR
jgi:hypothetical protein